MNALRHVALALHGLTASDQAWLLERLPLHADTLRPLIDELRSLGMPADTAWIDECLGQHPPEEPWDEEAAGAAARAFGTSAAPRGDSARRLSPQQAAQLLADEPDAAVAALLAAHPWPWRSTLWPCFAPRRSETLQSLANAIQPGPALCHALVEAFDARAATLLDAAPSPAPATARHAVVAPSLLARLRRRHPWRR